MCSTYLAIIIKKTFRNLMIKNKKQGTKLWESKMPCLPIHPPPEGWVVWDLP